MFRRRRRYGRGYGGGMGGNFGLMLLAFQLFGFLQYIMSRDEFLPTTLVTLAVNVLVFVHPELGPRAPFNWPTVRESCISVQEVWYQGAWQRVVLATVVHAHSWHLYYNMASFVWKARSLENHYGSQYFAYIMAIFTPLTSITYLAINYILAVQTNTWSYVTDCAVGFSGVIFSLKVLTTYLQPEGRTSVFGIPLPNKLSTWAELVVISVLFPNASFVGHLAGILVGVAYVSGPLKAIMDIPLGMVPGSNVRYTYGRPSYQYTARPSGTRGGHGNGSHGDGGVANEYDPSLQEAIDRSLHDARGSHDVTTETSQRPPPYNPEYHTQESLGYEGSHGNEGSRGNESSLGGNQREEEWLDREIEMDRERERRGEMSLDEIRLARVQRLSGRGGASRMGGVRYRQPHS